jgi:nucleoside-diphosphate kinase
VENTLVLLKPDAVERGLVGSILARFEAKGLQLVALKMRVFPEELLKSHYAAHAERPFFPGLVRFMSGGPVVAMILRGRKAIDVVRTLVGKTDGAESPAGTIRGDFGLSRSHNLVHASDGTESAADEIALWFADAGEICEWTPVLQAQVYDVEEELR